MSEKDFFKGQITAYAECIATGCKRIADSNLLEAFVQVKGEPKGVIRTSAGDLPVKAVSIPDDVKKVAGEFFKIARDIAREYRVKVQCKKIAQDYVFVLYKDHNALREYWELRKGERRISASEYHRRIGKLYGYSEKEIGQFVAKVLRFVKEGKMSKDGCILSEDGSILKTDEGPLGSI